MLPSDDQLQLYFDACVRTLYNSGVTVEELEDVTNSDYLLDVNKRIYLMFCVAWFNLPLHTAKIMFNDVDLAAVYIEETGVRMQQIRERSNLRVI